MNNSDGNAFSWIEDIRQKLEAISIEAENQVLSATDSIISFCSHAMDDLLPPVSDDPMTPDAGPVIFDESRNDSDASDKKSAGDDEIESNDDDEEGEFVLALSTSNPSGDKETDSNSGDNQLLDVQVSEQQLDKLSLDNEESYAVVNEYESFSTYKPAGDDETESDSDDSEGVLVYESEPIPTIHITGKRRSYKRKIRDILNQKRRSSSMNQMHQITDCSSLKSEKIADSDSMDSDWEFL